MPILFCPVLLHILKVDFLGVCPLLFNHPEIEVLQAFHSCIKPWLLFLPNIWKSQGIM